MSANNLWDRTLKHLRKRMLFVEELAPVPLASIGCHIGNLYHRKQPFYFVGSEEEPLNLPVAHIAPTGLSKTYTMKMFFKKGTGIVDCFKYKYSGEVTRAGFSGKLSQQVNDDEPLPDAEDCKEGFLLYNEMSNLFITSEQDYSKGLMNDVLDLCSENHISRKGGSKEHNYDSWATMMGGVQPGMADFTRGTSRRFFFESRNWTSEDIELLMEFQDRKITTKKRDSILAEVKPLRKAFRELYTSFDVHEIQYDKRLLRTLRKFAKIPGRKEKFKKILIGREIIKGASGTIRLKYSPEIRTFIAYLTKMERMVAEGTDISLMITALSNEPLRFSQLWHKFECFGYEYKQFSRLLEDCVRMKAIKPFIKNDKGIRRTLYKPGAIRDD